METLAFALVLNHREAADGGPQTAVPHTRLQPRSAVGGLRSQLITYAVEIEGDAPLIAFAEAVDD